MQASWVALIFWLCGLAIFGAGLGWRQGKLNRHDPLFAARAALLEPIGLCWMLVRGRCAILARYRSAPSQRRETRYNR